MGDYIYNLFRSRTAVVNMLKFRGYDMSNVVMDMDFGTFKKISYRDLIDNNRKIYVHYMGENEKLGSEYLQTFIDTINEEFGDINIIIVYTMSVSGIEKKGTIKNLQLFKLDEVIIDKTKHIYVPKHELIDDDEINELAAKVMLPREVLIEKMKLIKKSDPMSKYIGAKVGDVVKVTRKSRATGIYFDYRKVIDD